MRTPEEIVEFFGDDSVGVILVMAMDAPPTIVPLNCRSIPEALGFFALGQNMILEGMKTPQAQPKPFNPFQKKPQ